MPDLVVWAGRDGPAARCEFRGKVYEGVVGKAGTAVPEDKREGDGKTPLGRWRVIVGYYRADRVARPDDGRTWIALERTMGWCDAPGDKNYNRPVPAGYGASHERMWREDAAYDYVLVLDHNQNPVVEGMGSAIFLHVWREGVKHTEGCVALRREDLEEVLAAEAVDIRRA